MKVVLMNGPPRSGKDYAGSLLCRLIDIHKKRIALEKFARAVKVGAHAAYGIMCGSEIAPDGYFETLKDVPLPEFYGKSPRQVYIAFSESFMKPLHGPRIFGQMLLASMDLHADVAIVTDSGFRPESEVLVEHFGAGNCFLVRMHRKGFSFAGDSRGYIELGDLGVRQSDVENPGDASLRSALDPVVRWINETPSEQPAEPSRG